VPRSERAACVVTIDTGATHVASAVGTPTGRAVRGPLVLAGVAGMVAVPRAERVLRKPPNESDAALRASRNQIVAAVAALL